MTKILKEIDKIVLNEQFEFLKSTVNEELQGDLINLTFILKRSKKFMLKKLIFLETILLVMM